MVWSDVANDVIYMKSLDGVGLVTELVTTNIAAVGKATTNRIVGSRPPPACLPAQDSKRVLVLHFKFFSRAWWLVARLRQRCRLL